MSLPKIVAFCGYARHGKDTAADYLAQRYGYARYSLASPLKEAALILFGWSEANLSGAEKERIDPRWGISPRQALQALGTEYAQIDLCRLFPEFDKTTGRTLWVRRLLERCYGEPLTAISDCRFPHEADEIHKAGGIVIRVLRPSISPSLSHESEAAVSLVRDDYFAMNDGSIEDLHFVLDEIMIRAEEDSR